MTKIQVLETIEKYKDRFTDLNVSVGMYVNDLPLVVADPELEVDSDILSHCNSMLEKIEEFVEDGKMDKAFRWLGFIQGCLWCTGLYTIADMREHNR